MPDTLARTIDKGPAEICGACTCRNRGPTRDRDWTSDSEHSERKRQLVEGVHLTPLPARWHRREEVKKSNNKFHSYRMDHLIKFQFFRINHSCSLVQKQVVQSRLLSLYLAFNTPPANTVSITIGIICVNTFIALTPNVANYPQAEERRNEDCPAVFTSRLSTPKFTNSGTTSKPVQRVSCQHLYISVKLFSFLWMSRFTFY